MPVTIELDKKTIVIIALIIIIVVLAVWLWYVHTFFWFTPKHPP